jgi:hypothetical protein
MTAAFAAAAAVAVVAILALVLTARRGRIHLAAEKVRAEKLEVELQEEVKRRHQAVEEGRQAAAERQRAEEGRQDAENRFRDAEEARAEAVERADQAEQSLADKRDSDAYDAVLLDLERLRAEREWGEVTGTAEPLPAPWDGSLRAAIAAELEIVREVIGVPTTVDSSGASDVSIRRTTAGAARLASEIIRTLARVGEELVVSFDSDGAVIIRVATMKADLQTDLAPFGSVVADLGGDLSVHSIPDGFQVRLCLPPAPSAE